MKTPGFIQKRFPPTKLSLCIACALALGGLSGQATAAGCSYTTTAQLLCDNTTIYHYGNPLGGAGRDYSGFDEVRIDTTSEGTTSGLTGWGVYIDNTGYNLKIWSLIPQARLPMVFTPKMRVASWLQIIFILQRPAVVQMV